MLALDAVLPLDLAIPVQVFGTRPETPYQLVVCGVDPEVSTTGGFTMAVPGTLSDVAAADTVIVPGFTPHQRPLPQPVLDVLAGAHARGRRVVSICVGAFALAAAGVLNDLTATTHWQNTTELATRYPGVHVDPDALYVDQGQVLTSAGVTAGMDLCLHIVRRDLGASVANTIARAVVAAPHRQGGQAQYVDAILGRPRRRGATTGRASVADEQSDLTLAATRVWALERLHEPLSVPDLARHAHTSERTLARRFLAETGTTPLQWLLTARLDRARRLLEQTDAPVEQIADGCGLGSAANLRIHFRRTFDVSPTGYRTSFTQGAPRTG
ncbi:MAG: GlxA family transcriptional regulator [Janthinobacterium lividum]